MTQSSIQALIKRYPTHAAAAEAWGVQQPTVTRWANGSRSPSRKRLAQIAAAEKLSVLELYRSQDAATQRFVASYESPDEMIVQLESWFDSLPQLVRQKVVKQVMRTIADEAFSVLPMPDSWIFAMRRYGIV